MNYFARLKLPTVILAMLALAVCARAQIRDGGIDPKNLGKGVWIFAMKDATNKLGGHITAVTNINSLMSYYKSAGLRYCIIKSATSDKLFGDCTTGGQLTSNLVSIAHSNSILVFGYNRSFGSNIVGEVAMADYVFNQGADGFVFDAETEWETGHAWITNGPAQAWQLCSQVRSNWPNKFLAHAPFPIIYFHTSFPYKEFGYWCDAVMPQIYHFSLTSWPGIKESSSAAINWSDVNWATWQNSLAGLPQTNYLGQAVAWTNAIKPITPLQDVYGEVISGGITCEGAAGVVHLNEDVLEFTDYSAADPHAQTADGYRGINFWRADTIGTNQWLNISGGTSGNYSNVVNNLVLDDSAATYTGAWNAVKVFGATTTLPSYFGAQGTDTNSFGTNYCYKTQGGGTAFAQFRPNILIPGNYDVYQWHVFLTNASAGTPFQIFNNAGTNLFFANQQTNAGNWSLVGRCNFSAGTNNFIRVLDNFSDATNVAVVDGLKLMYADADIALDNTNSEVSYTGSWSTGSAATYKFKSDYRFASSAASVTAAATFRPNFPNAGLYDVFVWHSIGSNRATNAPWTISFFGGSTNLLVNQQTNGGAWLQIAAARPFAAGTNGFVSVNNQASNSVVIADGVKFSFAGPLAPVALSSLARQSDGRVNLAVNSTPGYGVWIERTTNLTTWQPLTNLLNTNGALNFTDSSASNLNAGFYRLRQN
ncbi:MAG: hypothetical protein RL616_441 [Verrucomicrobiota bacterium]